MNPLLTPEADDVVTERARTHWIDTNVMLEVYSHGDLYMKWGLTQCTKPPGLNTEADPEARRVRIQGAMWMAMALCHLRAVSLTYQHENQRNILRLAPPDSEVGGWTSTILYVLGDGGVFRGWDRLMTASGEGLSDWLASIAFSHSRQLHLPIGLRSLLGLVDVGRVVVGAPLLVRVGGR